MSHLKSLITPYDINNTCVKCLETLPHKAMNPIKGVLLIAASSEITTLDCLQNSISVHDMRRTQNDMKTSSLGAKRHRRLTEKHTDWKRDFNRFYDRSKHRVSTRLPAYPDQTHTENLTSFTVNSNWKNTKSKVSLCFLIASAKGYRLKGFRLCPIADICICWENMEADVHT